MIANVFTYWLGRKVDEQSSYTEDDFIAYLADYLNAADTSGNNRAQIQELFDQYYLQDTAQNSSNKLWYTQLTSVRIFGAAEFKN